MYSLMVIFEPPTWAKSRKEFIPNYNLAVGSQVDMEGELQLPQCDQKSMCGKGLYNRIRLVLDMKGYYYLAGEYMYCSLCGGTFIAWDQRMLDQLSDGQRSKFPAVLTRK